MTDPRRSLPQVDAVLRALEVPAASRRVASWLTRRELDAMRRRLAEGRVSPDPAAEIAERVAGALQTFEQGRAHRILNATGVLLHTNLGRAPLADAAIDAIRAAAAATPLELTLQEGARGGRGRHAEMLVAALTGAEDALVVNNNAGALVLALAALAYRREVIVSRGELVEIGGAFRLPAVLSSAGALLREVGSTNRTRISDVRDAIGPRTAAVLRVHPSNFTIVGFTEAPARSALVELCRTQAIPFLEDVGSGLLEPDPDLPDEPDAATALAEGADLVCWSGDKLLGGPQAGILAGCAELIEACRRHPLARAVRIDKLALAALEATLQLHAAGDTAAIPALAMRAATLETLHARAHRLARKLGDLVEIVETEAALGAGSSPGRTLPSVGLALAGDPERLAAALRASTPPVLARIIDGRCVCDLRSLDPRDDDTLLDVFSRLSR